ncbi:MAG TPA: hypothetical protein VMW46_00775 [Candidatus Desulfaltia sp.]|nr:hypothetical protein [Candidatus Desulfaltia sp.]
MTRLTKLRREVRSHSLARPLIVELKARTGGDGAILTMWEKHCRDRYSVSVVELFQRLVYEEVRRRK